MNEKEELISTFILNLTTTKYQNDIIKRYNIIDAFENTKDYMHLLRLLNVETNTELSIASNDTIMDYIKGIVNTIINEFVLPIRIKTVSNNIKQLTKIDNNIDLINKYEDLPRIRVLIENNNIVSYLLIERLKELNYIPVFLLRNKFDNSKPFITILEY